MSDYIKLKKTDLEINFDELAQFSTTMEIFPYKEIIGQKRAEKSIALGLEIHKKGYNIFISGHIGTGKTSYIINKIKEFADKLPAPRDWCYVYNFKDDNAPMAISLDTNTANDFKDEIAELIQELFKEVPAVLNSETYERETTQLVTKYQEQILAKTNELNKRAQEMGMGIKENAAEGLAFIPLYKGKAMTSEIYSQLSDEDKHKISENANELRLISFELSKETKQLKRQMNEELKELDERIAESIISDKIGMLKNKYGSSEETVKYLNMLREDIKENIDTFMIKDGEDDNSKNFDMNFFKRYEIRVIVANREEKGAPVIYEDNPSYENLFGTIEYENVKGNLITDFTRIRPGSLHIANGGYLIINAFQLLSNSNSWDELKRCLKQETITLKNSRGNMDALPILTLKPEGIPMKAKVILVGDEYTYSLLSQRDLEFSKLFKIKAEFDNEIEAEENNISEIIGCISNYVNEEKMLHVTRDGILELLRYSSRLANSRKYLSASMGKLFGILDLANYFANKLGDEFIDKKHIMLALDESNAMHELRRKKLLDMYKNRIYIVNFKEPKVGQINGLSVMDLGDCTIGQQHKITVTTYAGREGVINIEREAQMSGSIHSKGIMILSGFIGQLLGQDTALSFNARIVFEQLYSGIEGDSASAAELIALISSLGDVPIKQSLAITGSVNQRGEIQPIGGVNEKIEGYFDICKLFGLNGSHGVIIPDTNINDLVLREEILNAVDEGKFSIYAVKNIEECLEILSDEGFRNGMESGLMDKIKLRILEKLNKYNKILKELK